MKRRKKDPRENKNILHVTYGVVGVFAALTLYFGYFIQFRSEEVINNSYNARLNSFADRIVRGSILSDDGTALAETLVDESGGETRSYPYGSLFAHVVGYSGQNGKTGLEALGNFYLLSSHVNLAEKVFNELIGSKNVGDNIVTTLNLELQQVASDALGDRRGAVIVMEPDTGKVLAMVSKPGYDPNTIDADWAALTSEDNKSANLLNRATQGLYPPGSTFKIITLLEYIKEHPDYENFTFDCDGVYENGDYQIRCYHQNAHGTQTLMQAFANSCNGAFASLGLEVNPGKMRDLAEQFLYNQSLPLAIPYNKSSYTMEDGAGTWEILQTSIGQGKTQTTPMHNLMLISAVANGGTLMKPYFIDRVENVGGQTIKKFMTSSAGSLMSAGDAGLLTEFLTDVVTEGTGSAVRTDAYTVAGKTGSAEFETGKETHAWFVGFAPAEDPKVAVCVLVEESGSGGQVAAPIARAIFDWAASMDSGEEESE